MKRLLAIRLGAYGDCIVLTPVLRQLKKEGWHITVLRSERGVEMFKDLPFIDDTRFQGTDEVPPDKLNHYWKNLKYKCKADKVINFSESLEVALALHPRDPRYNYTKAERKEM